MTAENCSAADAGFRLETYGAAADAPKFQAINVVGAGLRQGVRSLIASTPIDDLKAYLRWQLVHASAEILPKAFVDENFDFFSADAGRPKEQRPRWQRCVTQTDERLGEALGKAFVEEAFGAAGENRHAEDGAGHQERDAAGHRRGSTG